MPSDLIAYIQHPQFSTQVSHTTFLHSSKYMHIKTHSQQTHTRQKKREGERERERDVNQVVNKTV